VLDAWKNFYEDLTDLKVQVINPKHRDGFLDVDAQVYVVHWDVLAKMPELAKRQWLHVIGDEVHRAQNRKAQQTKALKAIPATYRTGLSGTPLTNKPDQFWSVLNWLYPKDFSSYWRFFARYVASEQTPQGYRKILGSKNEAELLEKIAPFYVRHLKREQCCPHHPNGVMPWLPPKYYSRISVELVGKQKRAYEEMRKNMLAWVGDQEDTPIQAPVVVAQLMRLQQFADAYAEVTPNGIALAEPSSKLDALMELLTDNPDQQFVVFSQFAQMVKLAQHRLNVAGISHGVCIGDTPKPHRDRLVQDFQSGARRVFLGTIGAGGVGITLTAASTVVFLDRTWSPALNSQAEDRLHRPGQRDAVQVIDIMARNTVDLGRHQRLAEKWSTIKKLLGDT